MSRKRVVVLSEAERLQVQAALRERGKRRRSIRARILLLASEGHSDEAIAAEVQVDRSTVERTRRRFVEGRSRGGAVGATTARRQARTGRVEPGYVG